MKGVHFLAAAALALCGCGPAWLKKPAGQFGVAAHAGARAVKRLAASASRTCLQRAVLGAVERRYSQPGARPGFAPLALPAPLPAGAKVTWGGLCAQEDAAGRVFLSSLSALEAYAAALASASGAAGVDTAAWTAFADDAGELAALLGGPAGDSPVSGPLERLGAAHAALVRAAAAGSPDDALSALVQVHSREILQVLARAIP